MIYIGIDPGKSGGMAAIDDAGEFVSFVKGDRTEHDIEAWVRATALIRGQVRAAIEFVSSSPQQGVRSAFTFGQSYGFLRGLIVGALIPFEVVRPQKWQTAMGCMTGGNKNVSKAAAQRLWPTAKITHANADALLLAEYCRRINTRTSLPCIQGGA